MRLGGPARYVIEVQTPQDVADAYGFAEQFRLRAFALGYGANTLGHDEGFNGVIIINRMQGITDDFTTDGARLKIMGGEYWDNVVAHACEKGLTGIEALSKIPGLAGSAPVQNIGAYGQQLSDTLESVDVYDTASRTYKTLSKTDLHFNYRQSIFNTTERGRYFIISITLKLKPGEMPRPFYNSLERYIADHSITDFSPQSIRQIVSAIRDTKLPDPFIVAKTATKSMPLGSSNNVGSRVSFSMVLGLAIKLHSSSLTSQPNPSMISKKPARKSSAMSMINSVGG